MLHRNRYSVIKESKVLMFNVVPAEGKFNDDVRVHTLMIYQNDHYSLMLTIPSMIKPKIVSNKDCQSDSSRTPG